MAYNQKNNPFLSAITKKSPLFFSETPVDSEVEMKYPKTPKWSASGKEGYKRATTELGEIRVALGDKRGGKDKGQNQENKTLVKNFNNKKTGFAVDKLMAMNEQDINSFTSEIQDTVKPFKGLDIFKNPIEVISLVKKLDLSSFQKYFDKTNISVDELSSIITDGLDSMPDKDKDGKADTWQGVDGRLKRIAVNKIVKKKLKQLK
mgnify:CR=1 FL=1|jgi:hypothetical protein|tara:strand:- start:462 stop:1076 length:615 start_codon:yes stop_codon:yes gene_type:complete